MALPPIVSATLQTAVLSGLANVVAQVITAKKSNTEVVIDWIPVLQFLLFNILNTPPNFLWQDFLESTFPAYPAPKKSKGKGKGKSKSKPSRKLSKGNTAAKLVLDQTVGATVNTLLFSTFTRSLRAAVGPAPVVSSLPAALAYAVSPGAVDWSRVDFAAVLAASLAEFWPILVASWKVWPAVSLFNFTLVKTVEGRSLVGALAGLGWGIYMSLVAAS